MVNENPPADLAAAAAEVRARMPLLLIRSQALVLTGRFGIGRRAFERWIEDGRLAQVELPGVTHARYRRDQLLYLCGAAADPDTTTLPS